MKILDLLTEGIDNVLYHFTSINALAKILKNNQINLSSSLGTQADAFSKKIFFLSTARTSSPKVGYARNRSVRITFNSDKLKSNHEIKPIDYWQRKAPDKQPSFNNPSQAGNYKWEIESSFEYEDRILSDKPIIENANKYIISVDIIKNGDNLNNEILSIIEMCKGFNIPIQIYENVDDMVSKKNQVLNIEPFDRSDDYNIDNSERDSFYHYDTFFALLLYDKKYLNNYDLFKADFEKYLKEQNIEVKVDPYKTYDVLINLGYGLNDSIEGLKANLHNYFKGSVGGNNRFRKIVLLLTRQMKRYGVNSVSDLHKYKVFGIKPPYATKRDWSKILELYYPERDNMVIDNNTPMDSNKSWLPYFTPRNYGGAFGKEDNDYFFQHFYNKGTVGDVLNYIFNKYDFNVGKEMLESSNLDYNSKPNFIVRKKGESTNDLSGVVNEMRSILGLNEFLQSNMVSLLHYFSSSEEQRKEFLPDEYNYFFEDFLDEEGIEFTVPKQSVDVDGNDTGDDYESYELMTWLQHNNPELYDRFATWIYERIKNNTLNIPDAEYPAWSFYDNTPEIIKNQWLIHFTDDAGGIARDGFKFGVDEMSKLGLTTHLGEFDKKYGGYNFAYTLSDFRRYGGGGYAQEYKYGKEAVIFRASGIKLYHYGDEEPQVIFYGKTATNIIPLVKDRESGSWAISNQKTGRTLYQNDNLEKVVDWLSSNYDQYRKSV